ncbi:hypothetical protein A6764_19880 [Brevibacillus sp. WF146]|uniref:hypothetical protein n=1 Tax=Brevibacillus sp. WF146 TaxID=319501 RepID=UPI0022262001|nr:hypothetical protein [Brevibacillus sp. WF146]UYZ13012.1 hypothetical protein A6764_19880 [Brevibacillus sp. WF146]
MAAAAALALTATGGCEANSVERQESPAAEPVVAAPRPTVLADEQVPYTSRGATTAGRSSRGISRPPA